MYQETNQRIPTLPRLTPPQEAYETSRQPSPLFVELTEAVERADTLEGVSDEDGIKKATNAGNIGDFKEEDEAILSLNTNAISTGNQVDTLSAALKYLQAGLSVIPIQPGSKKAAVSWKIYQEQRMTEEEARQLFQDERQVALPGTAHD